MRKLKVVLLLTVVLILASGMNAMAAGRALGTESAPVLQQAATPQATAVFAALLANQPEAFISSFMSISNVLAAPEAIAGDPSEIFGNLEGTIEFYLWNFDGSLIVYETSADSPGAGDGGLNADGTLSPGQTYTVSLAEILASAGAEEVFTGYGWVIANFDGVQGTYNVTLSGPELGFTQNFVFEPNLGTSMGLFGTFGGIPVPLF